MSSKTQALKAYKILVANLEKDLEREKAKKMAQIMEACDLKETDLPKKGNNTNIQKGSKNKAKQLSLPRTSGADKLSNKIRNALELISGKFKVSDLMEKLPDLEDRKASIGAFLWSQAKKGKLVKITKKQVGFLGGNTYEKL